MASNNGEMVLTYSDNGNGITKEILKFSNLSILPARAGEEVALGFTSIVIW